MITKRVAPAIEQPIERAHVDLPGIHAQRVTVIDGDDQLARRRRPRLRAAVERLAQPRDVDLHGLGRTRRRTLTPERLDQPIRRDDLTGRQHQQGKDRALLVRPKRQRLAVLYDLQITQGTKLHAGAPLRRCTDRTTAGKQSAPVR